MNVSEFNFDLPAELIAQAPPRERGASRLLVLNKLTGNVEHSQVSHLARFLREGDLLVVNDTRVFPARLLGERVPSGGAVECLLLSRLDEDRPAAAAGTPRVVVEGRWDALVHPGQKLQPGAEVMFRGSRHVIRGEILERHFTAGARSACGPKTARASRKPSMTSGTCRCRRTSSVRIRRTIASVIKRSMHVRAVLLRRQRRGFISHQPSSTRWATTGLQRTAITLHVGYGTFQPVRVENVETHTVDPERFSISEAAADAINVARREKRRVVAVGTTTTRALEAAGRAGRGVITPQSGWTDLFIYPGFTFGIVDVLMTNFHLPQSSLVDARQRAGRA